MRRFLAVFVVAAVAAVAPTLAFAGNQEVAQQIANRIGSNSQMKGSEITVGYRNGTAWLRGQVTSQEQMKLAQDLVWETASVQQIDLGGLKVVAESAAQDKAEGNPLRDKNVVQAQAQTSTSWGKRIDPAFHQSEPVQPAAGSEEQGVIEPAANEEPRELPRQIKTSSKVARESSRVAMQAPQGYQRTPAVYNGAPLPMSAGANQQAATPARYDQPCMPNYAWPSYAAYPNYAAVTYPKQYSAQAWPYIGPFYPYPQVPMGWRKVTLQWDNGWWYLDFKDQPASCWHR